MDPANNVEIPVKIRRVCYYSVVGKCTGFTQEIKERISFYCWYHVTQYNLSHATYKRE